MTNQKVSASLSLRIDIKTEDWVESASHVRRSHPLYDHLSMSMDQMRRNAFSLQQEMILRGRTPCVLYIKDRLSNSHGGSISSEPSFLEVFDKVIDRKALIKGQGNTPATIQKYKRCRTHLVNYLQVFYKRKDIGFDQLNLAFLEDFEVYMRTQGGCEHNSTMKYIQTLKTIFRVARASNITISDPFIGFKISMRTVDREVLNEEELQRVMTTPLPTRYMELSRQIFVFSCFTGLSYIDLKNLRMQHIEKDDRAYWIRTKRQKSNVASNIPLVDIALNILREHHPQLTASDPNLPVLPVTSNQRINAALKNIARYCSVNKQLTFHMARHTFATTVALNNDVPIETVSKMLGHKRIATTQHYAKIIDKKVAQDMQALNAKLRFG